MTRFCVAYSLLATSIFSVDAFAPCSFSSRRLTSLQIGKSYLESLGSQEPDDENDSKVQNVEEGASPSFPPKVDLGIEPQERVPVPPTSPLDYQEPTSSPTNSIPTPPLPVPPPIEEEKNENVGVETFNPFPVKEEPVPVPPTSPLDYQEPTSSPTNSIPTPPLPVPPHKEEEKNENVGVETFNPFPVKEEPFKENVTSETVITPDAMMANISAESVKKTNDEETSLTIAAAAKSTLGIFVSRNYRNTKQALRESRSKNEKRLSRTNYEKEKVAEKIAGIKARAADQIKTLEFELDEKLVEYQQKFDSEMERIQNLLSTQLSTEIQREQEIFALKAQLEKTISSKREDIVAEEKITAEMVTVRSKLKPGNFAFQLDDLVEQKTIVAEYDNAQLNDLVDFVNTIEKILVDTKNRKESIETAVSSITYVDIASDRVAKTNFDFSKLEALERMWDDAAIKTEAENEKINQLKSKFDEEFINKIIILGEEIPEYLKSAATRLEIKKITAVKEERMATSIRLREDFDSKNEYELLRLVAKGLSNAAIDSSKAAIYGVKAVIDTVNEPTENKNDIRDTESGTKATKALKETGKDLSEALKAMTALGRNAASKIQDSSDKNN